MDIDEFLESEGLAADQKKGRENLVEKQSVEFISDLSIENKIAKIRELMTAKKYKEAEKVYILVKEEFSTLAKRQEDARRKITLQLTEVNKELLEHLNKIKGEMEQRTLVINDLLSKAKQYMQSGNTDKANELYLQVREIFKQIPDAFSEQKMLLENQILTFYSQLITEFNKKNYGLLLEKREQIMGHSEIATNHINLGNTQEARKEFHMINTLYNELPEGFLYEKAVIYKRILSLHQMLDEGTYKETKPASVAATISTFAPLKKAVKMEKPAAQSLRIPQPEVKKTDGKDSFSAPLTFTPLSFAPGEKKEQREMPKTMPLPPLETKKEEKKVSFKEKVFGFIHRKEIAAPRVMDAPPAPM